MASPTELLATTDFSAMTVAERAAAARFLERLQWVAGPAPEPAVPFLQKRFAARCARDTSEIARLPG